MPVDENEICKKDVADNNSEDLIYAISSVGGEVRWELLGQLQQEFDSWYIYACIVHTFFYA